MTNNWKKLYFKEWGKDCCCWVYSSETVKSLLSSWKYLLYPCNVCGPIICAWVETDWSFCNLLRYGMNCCCLILSIGNEITVEIFEQVKHLFILRKSIVKAIKTNQPNKKIISTLPALESVPAPTVIVQALSIAAWMASVCTFFSTWRWLRARTLSFQCCQIPQSSITELSSCL